jgi:hypothetical protein
MAATAGCSGFQGRPQTSVIVHNASGTEMKLMLSLTNTERNNDDPLPIQEVVVVPPSEQASLSESVPRWDGHLVTISAKETGEQPENAGTQLQEQMTWENVDKPLHVVVHPESLVFTVEPDW